MDKRQFFDKVAAMREAQREYFRTRSRSSLEKSKRLEQEIDAEIKRVYAIVGAPPALPPERSLFDNPEEKNDNTRTKMA